MHKTLYVDIDEEITSIIDRIRAEEAAEIFLVVPKEAMLTQGVINLKLLKKEIDKIGKTVMVATNDINAKKVIERLGIKTKEMTAEIEREQDQPRKLQQKPRAELKEEALSLKAASEVIDKVADQAPQAKKQMDIGSESFFEGGSLASLSSEIEQQESKEKPQEPTPAGQFQDMRKGAPKPPTSSLNMFQGEDLKRELYSKKRQLAGGSVSGAKQPVAVPVHSGMAAATRMQKPSQQFQRPQAQTPSGAVQDQSRKISVASADERNRDLFGNFQEESHKITTKNGFGFGKINKEKEAEKFFSRSNPMQTEGTKVAKEVKREQRTTASSSNMKYLLPLLVLLVVLGAGAMWAYANYPKVEISIYPKKAVLSKEIKIVAQEGAGADDLDSGVIPGSYVELTIGKSMEFKATGETFESDDGKARGRVMIYNKYSTSPQPLVSTTRVLSKEGKLFRLVDDITVPGMSGDQSGTIEVDVIADEPGEDYNIAASTFTIEGFKGNPKYEKFEVVSKGAMTDGGNPDSNKKLSMVSQHDLDQARQKTIDALDESLEQEVANQIDDNLQIVIDSVEKEITDAKASQDANDIANNFTYTVTQKVKAIAFSQEDVNYYATKKLEEDVDSGYAMDSVSQAVFKKGISDLEEKTVTMYIDAEAVAWPVLDTSNITTGIVGKKEEEIRSFLANYPEIEKVEITVTPSWLSTIPVSSDKVNVVEVK